MIAPYARRVLSAFLAVAALSGCQLLKKKADTDNPDGAAVSADGGAAANAGKAAPAVPTTFELVAVGKRSGSKIVWLRQFGDRVWLSGMGLDAFADGDGPLGSGSDLTQGLPQKPGEGWEYTGSSTHLFAMRAHPSYPSAPELPMVFAREGKGPWSSGAKIRYQGNHTWLQNFGFTPWKDGALYMFSQADIGNTFMYFPNIPGTQFQTVSPKGEVKDATFDLPKEVMAWSADSDGATLALVGHRVKDKKSLGASVFRGTDQGPLTETPIIDGGEFSTGPDSLFALVVREQGSVALAYQRGLVYGATALQKLATTVYVVADGAKEPKKILFAPPGNGAIPAAAYVGGAVYAIVEHPKDHFALSRAADGAEPAPVKLPSLAKAATGFHVAKEGEASLACEATDLFARKSDLWVQASCAGQGMKVPAVFRLGHPQEPIVLP